MNRTVRTVEDVFALLDELFAGEGEGAGDGPRRWTTGDGAPFWDRFYADPSRSVPFLAAKPDESLAGHVGRGLVAAPGRALDLGCGPGRNAVFLAAHGFTVDAVDLSLTALGRAEDRAREAGVAVRFLCGDAFRLAGQQASDPNPERAGTHRADPASQFARAHGTDHDPEPAGPQPPGPGLARAQPSDRGLARARASDPHPDPDPRPRLAGPYDLIVDSGFFHHLPPHRRVSYLDLVDRLLAPGGHLALACFAAGAMGSEESDADLYRGGSLHGGLAYTPEELRRVFAGLTVVELRRMRDEPPGSELFGEPFLWTALFRRDGDARP